MYNSYFGFSEKPFTIAPNPRYLYMSERHQEALAHMIYGMQGEGGVMVLTGEVGTGKTTICRRLLEQVPDNTNIAYIINPKLTALELLASICDELHISYATPANSIKVLTDLLNQQLLAAHAKGQHTVLIIDEAQNLDTAVLEQLRLLTNLETNEKKLLQIMLLGQPELAELLQRNELRQLAQRITARYHLTPLDKNEVAAYIDHRLTIAGCARQQIFSPSIMRQLYKFTRGVPRLINLIADRALLGAFSCEKKQVNRKILTRSAREVCGQQQQKSSPELLWLYAASLLLITAGIVFFKTPQLEKTPVVASAATQNIEVTMPPQVVRNQAESIAVVSEAETVSNTEEEAITDTVAEEMNSAQTTVAANLMATPVEPIPFDTNQNQTFTNVFATWDISYEPERDGDACTFARQHRLSCLRQRGDFAQMRSLSRPAVLTITGQDGRAAYLAVTALSGTSASVAAAGKKADIPLAQLALQSHNDFTILWRTPPGYNGPVRPGHEGELVQLLAEKCSAAENMHWIGAPRLKYDSGLKEQVKSFQQHQGLQADGVAGPITWIHINSLTDPSAPTLHSKEQKHVEKVADGTEQRKS